MTEINDGGSAFPRDDFHQGVPGMSLRDWFAGQALAGIGGRAYDHVRQTPEGMCGHMAADAYAIADAMLAERERSR